MLWGIEAGWPVGLAAASLAPSSMRNPVSGNKAKSDRAKHLMSSSGISVCTSMHAYTHTCIYVYLSNTHIHTPGYRSIAIKAVATWVPLCRLPEFYEHPGDNHRGLLFIFKFVSAKGLHLSLESQRKTQSQKFKNSYLECFIRSLQTIPYFKDKKVKEREPKLLSKYRITNFSHHYGQNG